MKAFTSSYEEGSIACTKVLQDTSGFPSRQIAMKPPAHQKVPRRKKIHELLQTLHCVLVHSLTALNRKAIQVHSLTRCKKKDILY